MQFDIAIIGGGPAGLALATSLAGTGLAVAVVEQQPGAALEQAGLAEVIGEELPGPRGRPRKRYKILLGMEQE